MILLSFDKPNSRYLLNTKKLLFECWKLRINHEQQIVTA